MILSDRSFFNQIDQKRSFLKKNKSLDINGLLHFLRYSLVNKWSPQSYFISPILHQAHRFVFLTDSFIATEFYSVLHFFESRTIHNFEKLFFSAFWSHNIELTIEISQITEFSDRVLNISCMLNFKELARRSVCKWWIFLNAVGRPAVDGGLFRVSPISDCGLGIITIGWLAQSCALWICRKKCRSIVPILWTIERQSYHEEKVYSVSFTVSQNCSRIFIMSGGK